jgi:hypothetical protein
MTEPMRDPTNPGRRHDDGEVRLKFNLKRAIQWVTLLGGVAGISAAIFAALTSAVVTPSTLKPVRDSVHYTYQQQELTTQALVRVNIRLDSVNSALTQFADIAETMAIDICLRRRNDPYALRKLNCQRYLGGD